jgi:hypothetical protein
MPKYTRRHYLELGGMYKGDPFNPKVRQMADMFAADNPRFQRDRFMEFVQGKRKR